MSVYRIMVDCAQVSCLVKARSWQLMRRLALPLKSSRCALASASSVWNRLGGVYLPFDLPSDIIMKGADDSNLDLEIPDNQSLATTSRRTRGAWSEKLDTLQVTGGTPHNKTVLYSSFAHTMVYPYEVHENSLEGPKYYSGYLDRVVTGESYSGYSIWDTFRAETAWLLFTAPERVPGMLNSMLQDYEEGGWLPMWKNIVESNIMVGTHADSIFAQAISVGVEGVDWAKAWDAVKKDAYVPPDRDTELR